MAKPKTLNKPRLGSDNKKSPMSKKVAKKQTKRKQTKRKQRREKGEVIKESEDIVAFITALSTKKYALANKYLQRVVEEKIKTRINSCLQEPLF